MQPLHAPADGGRDVALNLALRWILDDRLRLVDVVVDEGRVVEVHELVVVLLVHHLFLLLRGLLEVVPQLVQVHGRAVLAAVRVHPQLEDLALARRQLEEDLVAHLLDVLEERLQHLLEVVSWRLLLRGHWEVRIRRIVRGVVVRLGQD